MKVDTSGSIFPTLPRSNSPATSRRGHCFRSKLTIYLKARNTQHQKCKKDSLTEPRPLCLRTQRSSYFLNCFRLTINIKKLIDKLTSLPTCGFTAQLVKHRSGVAEVTGSNPVEAVIFFRLLPTNCLNWKIYCDDHSSLSEINQLRNVPDRGARILFKSKICLGYEFALTQINTSSYILDDGPLVERVHGREIPV